MQSSRKKNIGVASVGGKNPLSNLTSSVSGLLSDIVLWSTANFSPSPFANPHYSTRISYISLSFSLPPTVCSFIRQWLFFQSQFGVAVPFAPFDHSSPAQQLEQQLWTGSLKLPALGIRHHFDPYNFTELHLWRGTNRDKMGKS